MFQDLESIVKYYIDLTYNYMGKLLFQKKKYHDSVKIFNEALNFLPQDSGIYINRGDAYRELKKYNLALSDNHYAMNLLTGANAGSDTAMIKARLSLTHYARGSQYLKYKDYDGANIDFIRVRSLI